ncbi:MAG: hypothetical protein HWE39_19085 [Oceanospirillaceae bacterium]|nr:hypothetical protein [Oceanospirillaceae bacterium]
MINPLLPEVLRYLRAHADESMTEYDLMQGLQRRHLFDDIDGNGLLALFRKHFLIMNALYDLQEVLWEEEHRVLDISPLHIELHADRTAGGDAGPDWYPELSEYYLDWRWFETTTEADVQDLMAGFWQRLKNTSTH